MLMQGRQQALQGCPTDIISTTACSSWCHKAESGLLLGDVPWHPAVACQLLLPSCSLLTVLLLVPIPKHV
jgi:hypothetical protein